VRSAIRRRDDNCGRDQSSFRARGTLLAASPVAYRGGMRVFVEGKPVPPEQIAPRAHNFGQLAAGQVTVDCLLEIPVAAVVAEFAGFYRDYAEDDRLHGDGDEPPFALELRRLGWPPLERVVGESPDLFARLAESTGYDLVLAVLPRHPEGAVYHVNEVVSVGVRGAKVEVAARAIVSRE
jgi:hypothetical protein